MDGYTKIELYKTDTMIIRYEASTFKYFIKNTTSNKLYHYKLNENIIKITVLFVIIQPPCYAFIIITVHFLKNK